MNYEQLSLSGFIKEMKEVTDGSHPRRFCFVLGAGASVSSGIKTGQELVRIWDKDLKERNEEEYERWRKELSITNDNMCSFYSQYYEKRFRRCRADGYNYIEKIMESAKPSAGYVMLAHLLTRTPHNVVITTNFDHLTEDAVNYYAQNTPLVIGHERLAHYISGQPVRPTIIKIHRDLLFDPKSRAEDLESLPDSWKDALKLILENYHPIFVGYAGNDKSLMDFLLENTNKFCENEWKFPYWMLYKNDTLEGKVKDFLERSKGFYICHDGFDDVMIQLGAVFDYKIPDEEDFLEDARKRYKALAEAIDALSYRTDTTNKSEITCGSSIEKNDETDCGESDNDDINEAIEKITSQSKNQKMYRDAMNLQNDGNYADSAEILKELIKMEPNNARYHYNLAEALFYLNNEEESILEYNKAIELDPQNAYFHYSFANSLEALKKYKEAIEEYQITIKLEPEDSFNHYCLATCLTKFGHNEDAVREYRKAIELELDDITYHATLARLLHDMKRYSEALAEYQFANNLSLNKNEYIDKIKELQTIIEYL